MIAGEPAPAHVFHAVSARVDEADRHIIELVAAHRHGWATHVANATMYVGTTPAGLGTLCLVAAVLVVLLRAYRAAVVVGVALVPAMVAAAALKSLFERSRPPVDLALATASGYSFPSTQATQTSAIAAALVVLLLLGPGWGARVDALLPRSAQLGVALALVASVGLVGVCMVYLGAHWFTDVVAGWLLGTAIGVTVGVVVGRMPAPRAVARSSAA